jgi:hypothetical protein
MEADWIPGVIEDESVRLKVARKVKEVPTLKLP